MKLYKFVPTPQIADQIAAGVYRFYQLTKYVKLEEDDAGRADAAEGAMNFPDDGSPNFVKKLPIASFNGVEFYCSNFGLSVENLEEYFVFCMSTSKTQQAIDDCQYAVELETDIFDVFERFLHEYYENHGAVVDGSDGSGRRMFSHGAVDYYDIDSHQTLSIEKEPWRQVFLKHSRFSYQKEYRACLFVSDKFIERTSRVPMVVERPISRDGQPLPFNLKFVLRSGADEQGDRYVEFDISEFNANMAGEPSPILNFAV